MTLEYRRDDTVTYNGQALYCLLAMGLYQSFTGTEMTLTIQQEQRSWLLLQLWRLSEIDERDLIARLIQFAP